MKPRTPRSPSPSRTGRQDASGHALWTGTISFSLVAIPVHLVKAVEPGRVSFRLLHATDHSPLVRRMVCPDHGRIVPPDEIVRGFQVGPGSYVVVTDEELESVSPERSRTIEITGFVDLAEVDPVHFNHPYHLLPARGGEKAYGLLARVMERTQKGGIATFVMGERDHPVLLKANGGLLSLITLHTCQDILSEEELLPAQRAVDPGQKARMAKIVGKGNARFDPARYANERRQRILELLKKKEREQLPVEPPATAEAEATSPPDLVAALEESMRRIKGGRT